MLKEFDNSPVLIAIDQGYGQIKTPRFVFSTGIHPAFGKPAFAEDILEWFGQKYYIGQGHKDVLRDKTKDEDFRLLTMAAIAKELEFRGIRKASVYLALGLPLDWATDQMDTFRTYMQTPSELEFVFNDIPYEVEILDLMIYPQSFSAIAYNLEDFRGMNILCDIGHGTMSMMFINSGKPIPGKVYSEMMGVHQCTRDMKDAVNKEFHTNISDEQIEEFLRTDGNDIPDDVRRILDITARGYVRKIMGSISEHGFDPKMMRLHLMGGGLWLVKKFGDLSIQNAIEENRILLNEDIHATAKGYETMARDALESRGIHV